MKNSLGLGPLKPSADERMAIALERIADALDKIVQALPWLIGILTLITIGVLFK